MCCCRAAEKARLVPKSEKQTCVCVYMYMYMYVRVYIYIYIYIYIARREAAPRRRKPTALEESIRLEEASASRGIYIYI